MAERFRRADTIVVVLSPALCVWRLMLRHARGLGRPRADLPPGCVERVHPRQTIAFWWYVLRYRRTRLPVLLRPIEAAGPGKRVAVLRSRRGVRDLLRSVGVR
jgi:hypothetical protein